MIDVKGKKNRLIACRQRLKPFMCDAFRRSRWRAGMNAQNFYMRDLRQFFCQMRNTMRREDHRIAARQDDLRNLRLLRNIIERRVNLR